MKIKIRQFNSFDLAGTAEMMHTLKQIVKKIPFVAATHRMILNSTRSTEDVFTRIYEKNAWSGEESVSGVGSDSVQTGIITQELPKLFQRHSIRTMLDIPCGDFNWMKDVDRSGVDYLGADIVSELIKENKERYAGKGVTFQQLNLIEDELPRVDLVFCRDCLVHLPNAAVLAGLNNICKSGSTFLLTTTFPRDVKNVDIAAGQWRFLNLRFAPYYLPEPVEMILEGCTVGNGAYADKSLGLWRISDIRKALQSASP